MATYDITMREYNGANYDALYPKTVSQQVLLNDSSVATFINLTTLNPTVLEAISQLQTNLNSKPDTVLGSYVGTNEYGSSHPNSLTFPFVPKMFIISTGGDFIEFYYVIFINGINYAGQSFNQRITVTWNNKTCTWYSESRPEDQLNGPQTYYYFAIG